MSKDDSPEPAIEEESGEVKVKVERTYSSRPIVMPAHGLGSDDADLDLLLVNAEASGALTESHQPTRPPLCLRLSKIPQNGK